MKGLAWTRKMNLGASSSMEMMACARGVKNGVTSDDSRTLKPP